MGGWWWGGLGWGRVWGWSGGGVVEVEAGDREDAEVFGGAGGADAAIRASIISYEIAVAAGISTILSGFNMVYDGCLPESTASS